MTERKLDIFEVLSAANGKKDKFFDGLTPEEAKALQPFVLMRWLTGTDDEAQIMMLNEFVNPFVFSLTNHKKLLWQLLTVANSGERQRYKWMKPAGKNTVSRPIATGLVQRKYHYNTRDAIDAVNILTVDDLIDMAFDEGMPGDEITKLKKEMKK